MSYSISGFTTISCKAEDPIRNESHYVSKEAQAVVKARKEAQVRLEEINAEILKLRSQIQLVKKKFS